MRQIGKQARNKERVLVVVLVVVRNATWLQFYLMASIGRVKVVVAHTLIPCGESKGRFSHVVPLLGPSPASEPPGKKQNRTSDMLTNEQKGLDD
mmetsp:Transcript_6781/g.26206  ORF Transcript_6781/g.26206 Transcript_6781/m.26206 type:complete len:94 (+) Transcript_6781:664-945(+)|eukprot:scaffold2191_cov254-Pinguiococcus_pyrenoidosus.AAC.34